MLVSTPVLLLILARAYLYKENGGSQLKRASIVREKKYYELVEQLKDRTQDVTFSATKALSLLMLFSRYLVNYTNVESVNDINEECAKHYFNYLMKNHKRLGINLTDIKRSMHLISGLLDVDVNHYLKDFSLSNVTLWMTQER
ncbi:swarming motility protein SwrAA [Bacillus subtilis subsp. subtilis 6051-HGW]|jgi:hypothetical protein|uniref:SwrA n=1 Tax=Bacillus subtilis subsp. subtilis TaxID=135461 RepID=A8HTW0_BACIU|nr:SwrA [Bacillus subtilis subsp. subtilis NCIB 3610 = ATCC 6051 = DSM 10]AGG62933.1 swarming motility protein SwrAA [Bacillus subtilis subsp. subtilis 6051-HGW]AOA56292.1 Swarming motility protein SwrAA [Bacillus subtilis]ARW33374.1 Swarming motility protein SwrAA [Bacillus subtilis subsp. subtilis]CJS11750.1 Uncharacterised protein [Streptococcus pneumoniae]